MIASPVDRVLVLALDGMRADLLTPELTPNLWSLRQRGQLFINARSVFPSYTRVCTASVMAGAPPSRHGIVGNAFHHASAGEGGVLFLDRPLDLLKLVEAEGAAILSPTLDQALAGAGRRLAVVNGNTAGTAQLMLPDPAAAGHWLFNPHGRDGSAMPEAWDQVVSRFGVPPPAAVPLLERTAWLGRVFAELVLAELDPDVAFLWLAEPDTALHYRGTADPGTREALHTADAAAGLALETVERLGRAERTAVLAFSDHGQISCPDQVALPEAWADLGIGLAPGDGIGATMVVGRCGGISLLPWSGGKQEARLGDLAARLQTRPELGMLFSWGGSAEVPGTLPYSLVGLDHPRASDLVYILADGPGPDPIGLPGTGWTASGNVPPGGGMHGGLHPAELGNLLLLAVPGEPASLRDAPAGLVDLAPTVLALLGIAVPGSMTGRSLADPDPEPQVERHEAAANGFRQQIELARLAGASYVLGGGRFR